jgi:hypothetical protein
VKLSCLFPLRAHVMEQQKQSRRQICIMTRDQSSMMKVAHRCPFECATSPPAALIMGLACMYAVSLFGHHRKKPEYAHQPFPAGTP